MREIFTDDNENAVSIEVYQATYATYTSGWLQKSTHPRRTRTLLSVIRSNYENIGTAVLRHVGVGLDMGGYRGFLSYSDVYGIVDSKELRRYFQHVRFIPIMGMGKRDTHQLVHRDLPRQHPFGTTLRFTGPVPADSRQ